MDCGYKEKIILLFYGELPAEPAEEVRHHAETCRDCSDILAVLSGLSEGFRRFSPRAPELSAEELVLAARGTPFLPWFVPVFRRASAAAVFTMVFLAAFRAVTSGDVQRFPGAAERAEAAESVRSADVDSGLDGVDSALYAFRDELAAPSSDFDYGYAEIEDQQWRMNV